MTGQAADSLHWRSACVDANVESGVKQSKQPIRVIADRDLAGIAELERRGFELTLVPGREISNANVRGHDALLVRSITRVDRELLENTGVGFVGTATSGLDHIDEDYLNSQGIALAHAAGSNAEAVVDYCLSAMAWTGVFDRNTAPVIGIVGCGQVGSRLHCRLTGMGIRTKLCDPLLAIGGREQQKFLPLAELGNCDVVSLHVPLTSTGQFPTSGMIGSDFLELMSREALLIHSARGGVVDEPVLLSLLTAGQAPRCVVDVWQNEPAIDPALAAAVDIATPHIAGYSRRAKNTATAMIVSQLEEFVRASAIDSASADKRAAVQSSPLTADWHEYPENAAVLAQKFRSAFDLAGLNNSFKQAVAEAGSGRLAASDFDAFRKQLRNRAEFSELTLEGVQDSKLSESDLRFLRAAGFGTGTAQ